MNLDQKLNPTNDARMTKAIGLMLLSALSFTFMGGCVKMLSGISTVQVVFFRNFISLWIAIYFVRQSKVSFVGQRENRKYLLTRAICGLIGVFCYFYAISQLPLSTATVLNKMSPFFVLIFSVILLGEKISKPQVVAVFIAFIGMLISVGFIFAGSPLPILVGLFSAVTAGVSYVNVRRLAGKESPSTIIFWFSFISVIGMLPLMMLNFTWPTITQLAYLLFTGIFAAGGQYGLTYAYKYAPASQVSIYSYANIIFSMLLGLVLWQEHLNLWTVVGAGLIILASYINYRVLKNRK